MRKRAMQELINEELKQIPRGAAGSAQNQLRAGYQMLREHSLSQDPNKPRVEAFRQALEQVRQNHPAFSPTLTDQKYFESSE